MDVANPMDVAGNEVGGLTPEQRKRLEEALDRSGIGSGFGQGFLTR